MPELSDELNFIEESFEPEERAEILRDMTEDILGISFDDPMWEAKLHIRGQAKPILNDKTHGVINCELPD